MTDVQKIALKNDIAANTNTVELSAGNFVQIKDVPDTGDNNAVIADWYNGVASPDYFIHRDSVTRAEVYRTAVSAGDSSSGVATVWDWTGYKNQGGPEQDAWKEMFMGGLCDFGNQNNRSGVLAIFGTAGAGGANRTHVFNVAKRRATRLEKLMGVAVTNPPANTGNVSADARGAKTNPDTLGLESPISGSDVTAARGS